MKQKRTTPEPLTVAYIALGASAVLNEAVPSVIEDYSGQIGLMDAIVSPALLLDRVADYFDDHDGHPGVFQYEVSEPFGEAWARVLIGGDAYGSDSEERELLWSVMREAGYPREQLLLAFDAEAATR